MKAQVLILLLALVDAPLSGAIIDSCTDSVAQGKVEAAGSKGGLENNKLELVAAPVRAGTNAFRHWINTRGERSELAMAKTKIGGEYWYGWSMLLPADFDFTGSKSIVMQLATWPTPRNGKFPCSANGSFMHISAEGALVFHLQASGGDRDMICERFTVLDDVTKTRGKWIDLVMHAKWTGDANGFLRLWVRAGNDPYARKIDYTGRTFWNDEDKGPYFKMGLYTGEPGWTGPPERTVFTDEYRLGDENSSFDEVAPGR